MNLSKASKFNIIGTSGSGKSNFAKKLSEILAIPYLEMDQLFWLPNWTEPPNEVFFEKLKQALEQPAWVLDGNYTRTLPIKWQKVDVVIWLDYSFARTLLQAIRRAARRAWTQEELWEGTGNRESIRLSFFSKKSIIWWTITTHGKVRQRYESYMNDPKFSHILFVRLKNHQQAEQFLNRVRLSS